MLPFIKVGENVREFGVLKEVSSKMCLGLLRAELRGVGSDLEVAKVLWDAMELWVGVLGSVL